jgi:TP901 family phage tail tape measure protein
MSDPNVSITFTGSGEGAVNAAKAVGVALDSLAVKSQSARAGLQSVAGLMDLVASRSAKVAQLGAAYQSASVGIHNAAVHSQQSAAAFTKMAAAAEAARLKVASLNQATGGTKPPSGGSATSTGGGGGGGGGGNAGDLLSGLKDAAGQVAALTGITLGAAAAGNEIRKLVMVNMELDDAMSAVSAVSGLSKISQEYKDLTARAVELGRTTQYSAVQAAQGLKELAAAGYDASTASAILGDTLNVAATENMELGRASEIMVASLQGFRLEAEQSTRVADVLARAANASTASVDGMGEAFKYAAPTAAAMGISLEDTAAVIATLANSGVQAGMAGRGINSMFAKMVAPTKDAQAVLESFGVSAASINPEIVGIGAAMQQLTKLDNGALVALFGVENIDIANILKANAAGFDEMRQKMSDVNVTAESMKTLRNDNLTADWEQFTATLDTVRMALGKDLYAEIRVYVKQFTSYLETNQEAIVATVKRLGSLAVTAGKLVAAYGVMKLAVMAVNKANSVVTWYQKIVAVNATTTAVTANTAALRANASAAAASSSANSGAGAAAGGAGKFFTKARAGAMGMNVAMGALIVAAPTLFSAFQKLFTGGWDFGSVMKLNAGWDQVSANVDAAIDSINGFKKALATATTVDGVNQVGESLDAQISAKEEALKKAENARNAVSKPVTFDEANPNFKNQVSGPSSTLTGSAGMAAAAIMANHEYSSEEDIEAYKLLERAVEDAKIEVHNLNLVRERSMAQVPTQANLEIFDLQSAEQAASVLMMLEEKQKALLASKAELSKKGAQGTENLPALQTEIDLTHAQIAALNTSAVVRKQLIELRRKEKELLLPGQEEALRNRIAKDESVKVKEDLPNIKKDVLATRSADFQLEVHQGRGNKAVKSASELRADINKELRAGGVSLAMIDSEKEIKEMKDVGDYYVGLINLIESQGKTDLLGTEKMLALKKAYEDAAAAAAAVKTSEESVNREKEEKDQKETSFKKIQSDVAIAEALAKGDNETADKLKRDQDIADKSASYFKTIDKPGKEDDEQSRQLADSYATRMVDAEIAAKVNESNKNNEGGGPAPEMSQGARGINLLFGRSMNSGMMDSMKDQLTESKTQSEFLRRIAQAFNADNKIPVQLTFST